MASIQSLLNPEPERVPVVPPSPTLTSSSPLTSQPPRQKLTKDAPVFTKGKIRGELRYPPCELRDEALTRLHQHFQIHPMGRIAEYPRHIPYNSDKKSFQERTGRESFEVFQYTFKIPGEDKQWTVMWDYNIGLVRITHLFKCNGYSKTTPAKMLSSNPGLREICHSITGGSLIAQGYWMPFEAAKAVAATFCWKIRHALTPLFGIDFPSLCIHPHERTRERTFGRMVIHPSIVARATERANLYRMLELRSSPVASSSRQPPVSRSTPGRSSPYPIQRPLHRRYAASVSSYGSTPEYSDSFCPSPVSPYRSSFTPVNTPRSSAGPHVHMPFPIPGSHPNIPPSSPRDSHIPDSISSMSEKLHSDEDPEPASSETDSSIYSSSSNSSMMDPDSASGSVYSGMDEDEANDGTDEEFHTKISRPLARKKKLPRRNPHSHSRKSRVGRFAREVKAAHALLSLYTQNAASGMDDIPVRRGMRRGRTRRASA